MIGHDGMFSYATTFANERERAFFEVAVQSAYRSWWIMNKTLEDCPYCGDTDYLADGDEPAPDHAGDCRLGEMIEAYWAMREQS